MGGVRACDAIDSCSWDGLRVHVEQTLCGYGMPDC